MKTNILLPHYYQKIGWILLIPFVIMGFYSIFVDDAVFPAKVFAIVSNSITEKTTYMKIIKNEGLLDEISIIGISISLIFICFSKEKEEDEYIQQIRLASLLWAVFISYLVLIFATLFIYGVPFLIFMFFNFFTPLVLFIIIFKWKKNSSRRESYD